MQYSQHVRGKDQFIKRLYQDNAVFSAGSLKGCKGSGKAAGMACGTSGSNLAAPGFIDNNRLAGNSCLTEAVQKLLRLFDAFHVQGDDLGTLIIDEIIHEIFHGRHTAVSYRNLIPDGVVSSADNASGKSTGMRDYSNQRVSLDLGFSKTHKVDAISNVNQSHAVRSEQIHVIFFADSYQFCIKLPAFFGMLFRISACKNHSCFDSKTTC